MSAREDIAFLVGSNCRLGILRALSDEALGPSSLADTVSCARETAQRNLSGFVDRNWVEKQDGAYRLTTAGRMVLEKYAQLEGTVESAKQLSVFFDNCGGIVDEVDPELLAEQTVTTSTSDNPHAPIERWLRLVDGVVDEYYGITPIVSQVFNEAAESAIGPETRMELIIDESVFETSRKRFPDALELAFELDQFTLWMAPDELGFGLTVADDNVWLAAYDDMGNVVASVDGDDARFVDWAHDCYERYRDRSTLVESESQVLSSS